MNPQSSALTYSILPFSKLSVMQLHDLLRLRVDIFVVEQQCPYPEIDGKDPECFHLLGSNVNGELLAAARIAPPGLIYNQASVGRVVVRQDARGHRHGRELMEEAMAFCQNELKSNSIKLAAQHYLEKFYQSLGFVTISDIYPWDGIDHVDMIWEKE